VSRRCAKIFLIKEQMFICGQIWSCQLDGSGMKFKRRVGPKLSAWGYPTAFPQRPLESVTNHTTYICSPLPTFPPRFLFPFLGSGLVHSQNLSLSHARKVNKMQATVVTLAMTTAPNGSNNTPVAVSKMCNE